MAVAQIIQPERSRDAERKRRQRAEQKLVIVPQCEDRQRRESLEADDISWLRYYFGPDSEVRDPFTYEFTEQQREMIRSFRHAILYGGDQAVAASRGEGKTTILERLITKYTMQGTLDYSVLFQSTGTLAENSLDSIKTAIEENPLLFADYPEVCAPVVALENTPNRAHYQLVSGVRHDNGEAYEMASSKFTWCGQEIIFPNVPGSPSAGFIIATRGLDSAVRGLKKRGKRPKLAAIDDPDTEETARSEDQAKKLEDRIDKAIGGLGSQTKTIARILLTTLQSRTSVSYKFTDPEQKPSWGGRRFRYLVEPPDRVDLWEEYVQMRSAEFRAAAEGDSEDKHCRGSHRFYLDRQAEMDAGAVVANPNRFNAEILPDGSQAEVSALQHYYNEVARLGQDAVSTEYDNDPPEESDVVGSGISAKRIQWQLSGYPKDVVPPGCTVLSQGIDVQKDSLYYVVRAWWPDATNYVIDYGIEETNSFAVESQGTAGIEHAIQRAIMRRMQWCRDEGYKDTQGNPVPIDLTLVDSGWLTPAVYAAAAEFGAGIFPSKGCGQSQGCAVNRFTPYRGTGGRVRAGDGWEQHWQTRKRGGVWLTMCDTDRWKAFEHARWMTDPGQPGAAYLFGAITDEERKYIKRREPAAVHKHLSFAKHLTAEVEREEFIRGKLVRKWVAERRTNHYFDASYLATVAAMMKGIRLLGDTKAKALPPEQRPSARDLARR